MPNERGSRPFLVRGASGSSDGTDIGHDCCWQPGCVALVCPGSPNTATLQLLHFFTGRLRLGWYAMGRGRGTHNPILGLTKHGLAAGFGQHCPHPFILSQFGRRSLPNLRSGGRQPPGSRKIKFDLGLRRMTMAKGRQQPAASVPNPSKKYILKVASEKGTLLAKSIWPSVPVTLLLIMTKAGMPGNAPSRTMGTKALIVVWHGN